jgi:hypothetical protein
MKQNIKRSIFMGSYLALFQIAFIILMAFFAKYDNEGQKEVPQIYSS